MLKRRRVTKLFLNRSFLTRGSLYSWPPCCNFLQRFGDSILTCSRVSILDNIQNLFLFWTYPNRNARFSSWSISITYSLCAAHPHTSAPNENRETIKLLNRLFNSLHSFVGANKILAVPCIRQIVKLNPESETSPNTVLNIILFTCTIKYTCSRVL